MWRWWDETTIIIIIRALLSNSKWQKFLSTIATVTRNRKNGANFVYRSNLTNKQLFYENCYSNKDACGSFVASGFSDIVLHKLVDISVYNVKITTKVFFLCWTHIGLRPESVYNPRSIKRQNIWFLNSERRKKFVWTSNSKHEKTFCWDFSVQVLGHYISSALNSNGSSRLFTNLPIISFSSSSC